MKAEEIITRLKVEGIKVIETTKSKYNGFTINLYGGIKFVLSGGIYTITREVGEIKRRTFMTFGQCIDVIKEWIKESKING